MAAVARVGVELDARGAVSGLRGLDAQAKKTQGAFTKLRNAAVAVGAAAAAIKGAQFVFAKTAELETQTRSLKVLTGSLQDAQKVVKELQDFGAVTPFTSSELIETAKRLKAFGFETEKIVDVTKRLGDIAGATGADLGGIATAFGQIQAKGRLQGEELLQLQERGVDLQGTLRKEYGLTADEFQKALSKGQIGADAVNFALTKLTEKGGKYADGAIAQSDTLSGKLSTVQDNIDRIATKLGDVLAPELKNVLDLAIEALNAINQSIAARSLTTKEKQSFRDEAVREVRAAGGGFGVDNVVVRHLGKTYKGPPDQIIRQITNDLINKEVQRRAGTQALAASTANAAQKLTERPDLGGGTGGDTGGDKERVDMSQKMLGINQRLRAEQEAGNEILVATLELMQRRQEIAESVLKPIEKQNELEEAASKFRLKVLDIDKQIAEERSKEIEDAMKSFSDQLAHQDELNQLLLQQNDIFAQIGQTVENGLVQGLTDAITGAKSLGEALSGILKSVGSMLLRQGIGSIVGNIFGGGGGGSFGLAPKTSTLDFSSAFKMASGGFVDQPTRAVIGEGADSEYVIPSSKMNEAMGRYARGARGSAVIPDGPGGDASGGMTGGGGTIDVSYSVERINNVDYVSAAEFERGMAQAAKRGAELGRRNVYSDLVNKRSIRSRVGV